MSTSTCNKRCLEPAGRLVALRRGSDFRRAGHTLVEILLALGLSLVILVAVYASLDQHWRYAEAGQQQAERMQVTRALFETLSLDLRSVTFQPGGGAALSGDAKSLAILSPGLPAARDASVSETRTVQWRVQLPTGRLEEAPVKQRRRAALRTAPSPAVGLVRVARLVTEVATDEMSDPVRPTEVLAGEVESIRFRYFAAGRWVEQWDSVARQSLPQAVEITLGFNRQPAAKPRAGQQTRPAEYRLIVPLPASEA